ncbi:phosphatidylinositol 3-kinase [Panus rudis PR-1116 ss-1]|nr:phosphatidylinositol 3-kinase [Panus rudis PR-1116 ss-1]
MASTAHAMQTDVLDQIFTRLRHKSHQVRAQAAEELQHYVSNVLSDMSSDTASKIWEETINRKLSDLVHSQTNTEKLGGILAIDHLLDAKGGGFIEAYPYKFYNYVKALLPNTDVNVMLAASKTLGRIAALGSPTFGEDFMDYQVGEAIEILQADKQEPGRYAGVLILKELARNSPTYFQAHIGLVFDKILVPLRDPRLIVRESAAELLAACLEIITQRDRQARSPFLLKILQDAQMGMKMPQPEIIHGSLLTYRELLLHGGMFMKENFLDAAERILNFKTHRDSHVRKMVITLIPTLAVYDTQTFSEHYLHKAMGHLLTQLEKPAERSVGMSIIAARHPEDADIVSEAFIAIGHVATAVGSEMKQFLDTIMAHIKTCLQMHGKKNAPSEEPIFQCIGMLASAVGPNLTKLLHDQLDLMFACGLSEPLHQALVHISRHIPPLLKTIQDRLLDMLSLILSGQNYKPLGAPPLVRSEPPPVTREFSNTDGTNANKSPEMITLALNILGSFDFSGHILNEFVRNCALPYLEEDNADVRRAAALTCCRLFMRDPICYQASNHSTEIIGDVIDKLLTVGIADPEPSIRQAVLSSLHERFDKHLAQAENVRSLFVALNDEVFEIRLTAVTLMGRLALHNPAYVMPSLRKTLIQLLTEMEFSIVTRGREECTRLLTALISATQRLIKPYAIPMLRVHLPKADDPNPIVAANVLMCLGELSCVGGEEVLPLVPDLMNVILPKLTDPDPVKRNAALHTLGQVCSSTGYVVSPLVEHPQLLQILSRILRTESKPTVRREVIKVLGILGALDPYRRKTKPEEEIAAEIPANLITPIPRNLTGSSTTSDDYYQTVAINALLNILKDKSLNNQHHKVIEAIMSIFKTQGLKCVTFLPQIIPAFADVASTSQGRIQVFHLEQLAILIGIIKQHVRNHMPAVFSLVQDLWEYPALHLPLVSLVEALGKAMDAEFKPFISQILPSMLKVFDAEMNEKTANTQIKIFDAFLTFGTNIEEYLQLVIPVIMKAAERLDGTIALRKRAIQTIDGLSRRVNFSDFSSRIIHPFSRILNQTSINNELKMAVMDTLCSLIVQLGSDYAVFIPMINKCLHRNKLTHARYENLIAKLLSGERLPQEAGALELFSNESTKAPDFSAPAEANKMAVNQQHLKQAWDVSQISTKEDWIKWMQTLSVEFMKESPSHALRACMSLVEVHPPLAKELFNAAFISCWGELYDQYQEDLVRSIESAITSPFAPSEVVHRLLNLAEFMEHEEKPLPIENRTLGEYAMKFHAYAKALHYKELEFFTETSPTIIEALIGINSKLQQHDAAWGTLLIAREQYDVSKHEEWYERLGRWNDALNTYEKRLMDDPDNPDILIAKMRCLHALGEWDQLAAQVDEHWSLASHDDKREIAPMAAAAAWSLHDWDAMEDYIAIMKPDSADRPFYRAILAVHQNQFPKALGQIAKARDLLDPELSSLVGESYGRSYNTMVRAQMLSELEEIIAFKQYADQPDRQEAMKKTWMKRLQGCQPDVDVWQRILQVRALVLKPDDDPQMWIKFANLCRKSDRMFLAEKTINSLLSPEKLQQHYQNSQHTKAPPDVVYAHLKFMWAADAKEASLQFLRHFTANLQRDLDSQPADQQQNPVIKQKMDELSHLLARCWYKQGEWQMAMKDSWNPRNIKEILQAYLLATHYDSGWYKAWHTWALANFEVVNFFESQNESKLLDTPGSSIVLHVVQAVDGFFHSISLRNENALQDTLRLLTLWFKFGHHDHVSHAMAGGFTSVEVNTWLEVIPQIIARIQTPSANIRRNINSLLTDVGRQHPQALIYPLTVASKSSSAMRKNAAAAIMERMREHSPIIVEQALLVSQELIRVAILWHELWHEGLEEASRLYFTDKNPEGMIAYLEPLHDMLEAGPKTARETSFAQVFGRDLHEAREACRRYRLYGEPQDIEKAWEIYYGVFKKIEKQLPQLTVLDLQYVSPELLKAKSLELAMPGTYQAGKPIVKIDSFAPKLTVIPSKQRPRRLGVKGSDGQDYQYVLKGHEDLRQDERVMQLFSLVNNLLAINTDCFKRRLHIQRFPVIPLAPNAGLLGWVKDSDTLHVLVRDYRESRKVLLNIEYRLMLQMAPDYENLILLNKIEVFEYALENTTGQDLYRVLWLKSMSSEHWLERRATYTRSLAVNSMVGHILGLGDRHPSNLMLGSKTGKVVHIDFGDCFEVAMHREKFPEKIPFRLTRMLTHAMEVSGIEGSFRNTCEISMTVLRENKESLMAVLEAFVYDPLINWRLMQTDVDTRRPHGRGAELRAAAYPQGPTRKLKADENDILNEDQEVRNERALFVYNRVQQKLTGRDFNPDVSLKVPQQVDKLILQATSIENLCQCFSGWCAFW